MVKQKGANGLVTETYMTKRLNGKVISTKLLSKDTYSAMQRIINRGKSTTSSESSSNKTTTTTTETNKEETTTPKEPEQTQETEQPTQPETTE